MLLVDVRHRLGDFRLNIMMEAPSSGITVIVGSSGAGKSSLLAIIAGHLRPHQGMIRLGDALLLDTDAGRFVPPERRRIGIVHQDSRLFPHMPVSANLLYGLKRTNRPIRIKPEEVVEILSIGHLLDRQPRNLSGGERQRVALGRAMLSQPDLLLMDEPVSALDPRLRSDVLSLTQSLNQRFGLPILYVTHNVEEARQLADHVVRLDHGKVIAHGRPQDLLPSAWLTGEVIRHENGRTLVLLGGSEYWLPEIDAPPGSMVTLTAEHPSESTA